MAGVGTVSTRIFVSDGGATTMYGHGGSRVDRRTEKMRAVGAYLYTGWHYAGWGSDPCGKTSDTGFLYSADDAIEKSGFGSEQLLARLASGLHFGHVCQEVTR